MPAPSFQGFSGSATVAPSFVAHPWHLPVFGRSPLLPVVLPGQVSPVFPLTRSEGRKAAACSFSSGCRRVPLQFHRFAGLSGLAAVLLKLPLRGFLLSPATHLCILRTRKAAA